MYKRRDTLGIVISGLLLSPFRPGNVVTFHTGRSGSTVLGDLLNQHPNIFWDAEVYRPDRMERVSAKIPGYVARDYKRFLRLRMMRAGKKIYGFETQLTQLKHVLNVKLSDYVEQLQNLKFHYFILLERRNYLRKIASAVIGNTTSQWHLRFREKAALTQVEVDVDNLRLRRDTAPKPLLAHLQEQDESFHMLKEILNGQKVLHLTYEDDIAADPLVGYRRVCDFLGVAHREVEIRYNKTNPFNLTEIIINFDEVKAALRGTPFEWMLYA